MRPREFFEFMHQTRLPPASTADIRRALTHGIRADSAQSASTGLGVLGTDKSRDARPADVFWLGVEGNRNAAIVDTMISRAITTIPEDALGEGWRVDARKRRDTTWKIDEDLCTEEVFLDAGIKARQWGGCVAIMVCDGVRDFRQPLPPGRHKVLAVHPMEGPEAIASGWCTSLAEPSWTRPEMWAIAPMRPGATWDPTRPMNQVHHSHVLWFPGLRRLTSFWDPSLAGYDLSVPQAYWEACRDIALATRSAAIALMEQSMGLLKLKGGGAVAGGSMHEEEMSALELFSASRSTLRTGVVMGEDDFTRQNVALPGFRDAIEALESRACAVEGLSRVKLFGTAPAGMSSDDEADRRGHEAIIKRYRRFKIEPVARRLYDVAGGPSDRRVFVWPAINRPTPEVQAKISKELMERDVAGITAGIYSPAEVRGRFYAEDGENEAVYPIIEPGSPPPEPPETEEAEMAPETEQEDDTEVEEDPTEAPDDEE